MRTSRYGLHEFICPRLAADFEKLAPNSFRAAERHLVAVVRIDLPGLWKSIYLVCFRIDLRGLWKREKDFWIRADDAYFVGEIYTLSDLSVWFCAEKGFLSIDSI